MKKLLVLFVITAMIFGGCSVGSDISDKMKNPDYPGNENDNTSSLNDAEGTSTDGGTSDVRDNEEAFYEFIDLVDDNKKPSELKAFIDGEIGRVPVEKADEMILAFEEVQKVYESHYQQQFFREEYAGILVDVFSDGLGSGITEKVNDESLKALLAEVFNGGYKLISREGSIYPVQDYSVLKKYTGSLTPELGSYIEIMSVDSDEAAAVDAAVVVSWDELASRLLMIEEHTGTYPDFSRNDYLQYMYDNYLRMYLIGLPNTPAYDYRTKVYKDEVIESFEGFISSNENSETAGIVKEYLELLKQNDYLFSAEVEGFDPPERKHVKLSSVIYYEYINHTLTGLLPENEGYKWVYNGFAEYGHEMTLEDIIRDDGQTKYMINGKVFDMSDGESGKPEEHYDIDLVYTITDAAILQTKTENMMLDSIMDSLELIRAPLIVGGNWLQIARDKDGNDRYLNCKITGIDEVGGSKVYTVEYRDQDSDYYEIRMIEENAGVVSFSKLWESDGGAFEIGYSLFKDASGY